MSNVLTAASDVECGHLGAVSVSGVSKLKVSGNGVLVQAGVAGKSISGCSTPNNPSTPTKPCATVTSVLPVSIATKLKVSGQGVVLDTLKGVTDGVPPGSLQGAAQQTKLKAT